MRAVVLRDPEPRPRAARAESHPAPGKDPDRRAARGEGGLAREGQGAIRNRQLGPGRAAIFGREDEEATVERIAEGDAAPVVPEVETVEEALRALVAIDRAPARAAIRGQEDARRRTDRERHGAALVEAFDVAEVARRELGRVAVLEAPRAVGRERDRALLAAHPDDPVVDDREAAQRDLPAELRGDQPRPGCCGRCGRAPRLFCFPGAGAPVATIAVSAAKRPVKVKAVPGIIA